MWTPEFVSVELLKVKKYSKATNNVLKVTANLKVMENLKRSWKKSRKIMEFVELKRRRTLKR